MQTKDFIGILNKNGIDFFTGVPDSLLNTFCFELLGRKDGKVKIGVNEGACVAMAAGHYMATGQTPCVFMQNSGLGNTVNPVTSLAHEKVYAIPSLFIVGWRGEPGVKDEPQHVFMGEVTLKLLELLEIEYFVIDKETPREEIEKQMKHFSARFAERKSCAFVVRKGALAGECEGDKGSASELVRENVIEHIASILGIADLVVSSTGKISRELFEIRERRGETHETDFLTVGSMGFASSIALQISGELPERKVICIDGDGAALMHLGAMATAGAEKRKNLVHIIIDNESHETVGGVPTVSGGIDWEALAKAVGYKNCRVISSAKDLKALTTLSGGELIVIKTNKVSRHDLGRPTTTARENIDNFMNFIKRSKNK